MFSPLASLVFALAVTTAAPDSTVPRAATAPRDSLAFATMPCHATRLTTPLKLDGVLDEPVWTASPAITAFTQREPHEGAPPRQKTEVRLAYDDQALYVGARLYDTAPDSILARLSRRDNVVPSDAFALFLDPLHDRRSGYYFMVNAAGTLFDGTLLNDSWDDDSWDGVWEGRAHVDSLGWTVEMRIPYAQLRFANQAHHCLWGVNFKRVLQRYNEQDYLVYQPHSGSGFVSRFPDLVGIEHIRPGGATTISPYFTGKASLLDHAAGDPFHDGSELKPNGGLDLRSSLGSKLTLVATANPDFGQVEVDPEVVNLSDVETFYPEKRPFFVEGSSNFSFGQEGANDYWGFNWPQPTFFYSRRIGRAPSGAVPDAAFEDVPSGTTILGAAKLTGKITPSLNFGLLTALTSKEDARLSGSADGRTGVPVEPASSYNLLRMQKEFPGRRTGLGVLVANTSRSLGDSTLASEFNRSARILGTDGWWFLDKRQNWVVSGYTIASRVTGTADDLAAVQASSRHYFQRPDADHVRLDPTRTDMTGLASRYWLNHQNGNVLLNSAVGFISPGFEVNDLGFQSRSDVINAHVGGGYKWTDVKGNRKMRQLLGAVFSSWDFDGNRVSTGLYAEHYLQWISNWDLDLSGIVNARTMSTTLTRGGPRTVGEPGASLNLSADTDSKSRFFFFVTAGTSQKPSAHTSDWNVNPGVEFKPVANVTLRVGPGFDVSRTYAQYITTTANPANTDTYGNDYVFATLDQRTLSANIRLNWAFTPNLSLQFFGQPLVAIGRYSDYKALAAPSTFTFRPYPIANGSDDFNVTSLRGNAVLRWEYRPGSAFYLVWTHTRYDDAALGQEFDFAQSADRLFQLHADNIFLAKFSYYFHV
jgi:hypothetical protein